MRLEGGWLVLLVPFEALAGAGEGAERFVETALGGGVAAMAASSSAILRLA